MTKRVLVTGSEGSLMTAVIPKLLEKNYIVYGADNLSRYGRRHPKHVDYKFLKQDLRYESQVTWLMDHVRPDVVIQGAARIYGVGGFNAHCADILGDDIAIQTNLLKAATQYGVERFVYISSSMVYETCGSPCSEEEVETAVTPYTDYGLSKLTGERLARSFYKQYRMPYTIWRPFNIITPYENADMELGYSHVFADFLYNLVVKKLNPLPIIGDGKQVRCFTWIDDVAQAIVDNLLTPASRNEIFNIGNAEPICMRSLAEMIYKKAHALGLVARSDELDFQTVKEYPNDVRIRIPDVSKIERILGWTPTKKISASIDECLKEFVTK